MTINLTALFYRFYERYREVPVLNHKLVTLLNNYKSRRFEAERNENRFCAHKIICYNLRPRLNKKFTLYRTK